MKGNRVLGSALVMAGVISMLLLRSVVLRSDSADASLSQADDVIDASGPIRYFETRQRAFAAFRARNWDSAASDLRALTTEYQDDSIVWNALGTALLRLHRSHEAINAFERALALGGWYPENICYDIAQCHARLKQKDQAFAWLERALSRGFESRPFIQRESDFALLRTDPRWVNIVATAGPEDQDRVQGWRSDLEHLWEEIERLHVDYRDGAPLEKVHSAIAALQERIPNIDDQLIPPQMQRIVRMLGSGHSGIWPVSTRLTFTELPLSFYRFPTGWFVIDADKDHERWIGCRVEAIGRGHCQDFAADLEPVVNRDNPSGILWYGPSYLKATAYLRDMGYVDSTDEIPVTLETTSGELVQVSFKPVPVVLANPRLTAASTAPDTPLFLSRISDHYWHRDLGNGVVYVQLNQMWNQGDESMREYARRLRETLRGSDTSDLVLDLRHNNGGDQTLALELLRTLIFFETTRDDTRVYVLIGRNTFSAAQNFLNDIERMTDAVLVGEASGSRPNMIGETTEAVLPYSGIRLSIGCRFYQDSYPGDERVWIAPHIPVQYTAKDHFAGRDTILASVQAVIRQHRSR